MAEDALVHKLACMYMLFVDIYTSLHNIAEEFCVDGGECSGICAVVNSEEKCFCPAGFNLTTPTECTGKPHFNNILPICSHNYHCTMTV